MGEPVLSYCSARKRRRILRIAVASLALYVAAYAALRLSGRIYPYFSQGSWTMASYGFDAIPFWPLMICESYYHDAASTPPPGG